MAARATTAKKAVAKKTTVAPVKRRVRVAKKEEETRAVLESASELHAYIPDPSVAERYVNRQVWGVWDATIAHAAMMNKQNILLMGDTGSGKTLFGEAYAAKMGLMYYSLPCDVSIDPSSLFGRMQPTDVPGKFRWQDGPVTQVVRHGGVLNISEINFMTPKIAASLYPLLDGRRYIPLLGHEGEVVLAHPKLLIIADMNPHYRGTMELNAAFKNRFDFKIPWGYSEEVEEKLVNFPTMREIAKQIRELRDTEIRTPLSTNMLMEFESFAMDKVLGLDFAIQNFLAAFDPDEQQSISKVFDLQKTKLQKDMAFLLKRGSKKAVSDEELEEIEFEQENEA